MNNLKREFLNYFTTEEKKEMNNWKEFKSLDGRNIGSFIDIVNLFKVQKQQHLNMQESVKNKHKQIMLELNEKKERILYDHLSIKNQIEKAKKELDLINSIEVELTLSEYLISTHIRTLEGTISSLIPINNEISNINRLFKNAKNETRRSVYLADKVTEWFNNKFCPPKEEIVQPKKKLVKI